MLINFKVEILEGNLEQIIYLVYDAIQPNLELKELFEFIY